MSSVGRHSRSPSNVATDMVGRRSLGVCRLKTKLIKNKSSIRFFTGRIHFSTPSCVFFATPRLCVCRLCHLSRENTYPILSLLLVLFTLVGWVALQGTTTKRLIERTAVLHAGTYYCMRIITCSGQQVVLGLIPPRFEGIFITF